MKERKIKRILIIIAVISVLICVAVFFCRGIIRDNRALDYTPVYGDNGEKLVYEKEVDPYADEETYVADVTGGTWSKVLININKANNSYTGTTVSFRGCEVDDRIAGALQAMLNAAKADGVDLVLDSAVVSFEEQDAAHAEAKAALIQAGKTEADADNPLYNTSDQAKYSEHCAGLAVDIVSADHKTKDEAFAQTEAYTWLTTNAKNYGFVLRYPENGTNRTHVGYRPWHYRFVGQELATYLTDNNLTMEAFFGAK